MSATAIHVHTRWMIRADLPQVLDIEQRSFADPWNSEDFCLCLRERNTIGLVAEHGEEVVGYVVYDFHKHRMGVLNLAVGPEWRRASVGSQLVGRVKELAKKKGRRVIVKVAERNLTAQYFFRKMGFSAVLVLRGFYEDTGEDAYLMEWRTCGSDTRIG